MTSVAAGAAARTVRRICWRMARTSGGDAWMYSSMVAGAFESFTILILSSIRAARSLRLRGWEPRRRHVEADITHFISAVELQGSPTALHRWQGRRKTIERFRSGASNREEHIMAASPAGPPPSSIKYGRIPNGYCVRIEGRGDMRQSPAVESLATR